MGSSPVRSLVLSGMVLAVSLAFAHTAWAVEAGSPEQYLEQGLQALQRGAFEDAVSSLSEAVRLYERAGKADAQGAAPMHLAQAHSALGQYRQAIRRLETALALAEKSGRPAQASVVLAGLGNAAVAVGELQPARTYLTKSLDLAKAGGDSALEAAVLNDLGNLSTMEKKYPEAISAYRESSLVAKRVGHGALTARALSNAAVAFRRNGQWRESETSLDAASDEIRVLGPSHDTAFLLIGLGLAYRDLRPSLPSSSDRLLLQAAGALTEAVRVAENASDRRAASYAWGYLGTLYEDDGRFADALQLTRKAVFAAQQVNAPESLYRWQWQAGRVMRKLGVVDDAISAYRHAVQTLQSIRAELSVGFGGVQTPFRESVGPVYFELVDLLLQRAASLQNAAQIGPYLIEARESVELLKAAELRDYFRDDCVDTLRSKITSLDVLAQTAVVVYPILLPDRTELLVSLPTGLKRISVPVGAERLTREVRELRRKLEKRTTREYFPHARQLYEWLIRPLETDLAPLRIETLVFVPDGPLRTIPMAALHDGKQFLVEKYALAITPGLNLTDPRPVNRPDMKVLAVGVTEAIQGFPALPNVTVELDALRNLFKSTTLVNQQFVVARLEKELKEEPFTIVHVASHGHFGGDVKDTFLLAFDDKLTMDRLNDLIGVFKFRDDPLDLLTLSACDTAAGDDRAALGLAGVAVKAGARSALATLWDINDRVSADLVAAFYRELKESSSVSRATALRHAQMKILTDPRYEHPGFWSPFLLINNWL
jgi:CHAT domain-containing protein